MASLNDKTTDRRLSFQKYVTDNKRWKEISFEIEKDQPTAVFTKKGTAVVAGKKIHKPKTPVKILDSKYVEIGKTKYASVQIGSEKGLVPLKCIRKPTGGNGTQFEDEVVDLINETIISHGCGIDVRIKGSVKVYKNIQYAVKVDTNIKRSAGLRFDPKCDIILCQDIKKPVADSSIYISHKKAGGPEAFQQYGGISEGSSSVIYKNPRTQEFLRLVAQNIGDGDSLKQPIMAYFNDDKLKNQSIFGPDFGKPFGLEHVQLIGQGKPALTRKGEFYELDFTSHMSLSGKLSHFTGGYQPVFGATYRAGRGFNFEGKRYTNARLGIYPFKLIGTRSDLIVYNL